jgi:hypothetical protein
LRRPESKCLASRRDPAVCPAAHELVLPRAAPSLGRLRYLCFPPGQAPSRWGKGASCRGASSQRRAATLEAVPPQTRGGAPAAAAAAGSSTHSAGGRDRGRQHGERLVPHLQFAGKNDIQRQGLSVRLKSNPNPTWRGLGDPHPRPRPSAGPASMRLPRGRRVSPIPAGPSPPPPPFFLPAVVGRGPPPPPHTQSLPSVTPPPPGRPRDTIVAPQVLRRGSAVRHGGKGADVGGEPARRGLAAGRTRHARPPGRPHARVAAAQRGLAACGGKDELLPSFADWVRYSFFGEFPFAKVGRRGRGGSQGGRNSARRVFPPASLSVSLVR